MPYKNEDEFVRGQKMKIILIIIMLLLAAIARAQTLNLTVSDTTDSRGFYYSSDETSLLLNKEWWEIARDPRLYDRLNEIRKEHGLKPLSQSSVLELKAGRWLKKMHEKYYSLTHDRASKEAELLTDCRDPLTCWMRSKVHRKILLSKDYTKIGIVLVEGDWCARLD